MVCPSVARTCRTPTAVKVLLTLATLVIAYGDMGEAGESASVRAIPPTIDWGQCSRDANEADHRVGAGARIEGRIERIGDGRANLGFRYATVSIAGRDIGGSDARDRDVGDVGVADFSAAVQHAAGLARGLGVDSYLIS